MKRKALIKRIIDAAMILLLPVLMMDTGFIICTGMSANGYGIPMAVMVQMGKLIPPGQKVEIERYTGADAELGEGLSVHYSGGSGLPEDVEEWLKTNNVIQ